MPTPAEIILAKIPLPTHLDSAGLRERWAAEIRRRAFFSARMASMGYIRTLQRVCAAYAEGRINAADARMRLRGVLDALGLSDGSGGLTDHGSDRRLGLILDTQRQMAATAARLELQTPEVLAQWPAWRLTRFVDRSVPRDDWPRRWRAAGEAVGWQGASRTRMVALKASPIWRALGDGAGGFKDTLGNPYPPFAYGSGMDWEDVGAEEAQRLGLPTESAATPQKASLDPADREILEAMRKTGLRAEDFLPPETRTVRNAAPEGGAPRPAPPAGNASLHPHLEGTHGETGRPTPPVRNASFHKCPKCGKFASYDGTCKHCGATLRKDRMIQRGREALSKATTGNPKDVPRAMHKPGLGTIHFLHGWEGKGEAQEHGKGLAKMLQKHHKELDRLPETIAKGKVYRVKSEKTGTFDDRVRAVIHGSHVAFLSKHGDGWAIVTHYDDERKAREIEAYNR